jgi:hypothetical protein
MDAPDLEQEPVHSSGFGRRVCCQSHSKFRNSVSCKYFVVQAVSASRLGSGLI